MQIYLSKSSSIYFNLAFEEFLLRNKTGDYMLLWKSEPCMVVGKHQNLYKEINFPYVHKNSIGIARRISGGGTVYHDYGNLNFSFIRNGERNKLVDFKKQTQPIIEALQAIGVRAELGERNNIFINGKKISGNAEHVYKNRVLHHGTLLFNAHLEKLTLALAINKDKYTDKAIRSVSAQVTNINEHCDKFNNIDEFALYLFDYMLLHNKGVSGFEPDASEAEEVKQLAVSKYITYDWVYGYSPAFIFKNSFIINGMQVDFQLQVKKGVIESIESNLPVLAVLKNKRHHYTDVYGALKEIALLKNIDLQVICYSFFY